jgi:hypothetical protein
LKATAKVNVVCVTQCCAVAFIESMKAASLNLSPSEYMRYMNGEAVLANPFHRYTCEGLALMQHNREMSAELQQRLKSTGEQVEQLQQQMRAFREQFVQAVDDVVVKYPWDIRPARVKVNLDSDDVPDGSILPPPLLPLSSSVGAALHPSHPPVAEPSSIGPPPLIPTIIGATSLPAVTSQATVSSEDPTAQYSKSEPTVTAEDHAGTVDDHVASESGGCAEESGR